jgi:hypothetical protein
LSENLVSFGRLTPQSLKPTGWKQNVIFLIWFVFIMFCALKTRTQEAFSLPLLGKQGEPF